MSGKPPAIAAEEYRRMRQQLGSQPTVARMLEVDPHTLSRRERGELPIRMETALAMRYLVEAS